MLLSTQLLHELYREIVVIAGYEFSEATVFFGFSKTTVSPRNEISLSRPRLEGLILH